VHQTRDEPLQQLPLAQHDDGSVAQACGDVVGAVGGRSEANDAEEKERPAREERRRDGYRRCERDRAGELRYPILAFRISAVIAGTISCRSPTTA
jgi:hypothetical protein